MMKKRLLMWILWPSFLIAALGEGALFSLVDPADLQVVGTHAEVSREAIYTGGFFLLWAICAASSALSLFLVPRLLKELKEEEENSLI